MWTSKKVATFYIKYKKHEKRSEHKEYAKYHKCKRQSPHVLHTKNAKELIFFLICLSL